MSNARGTWIVDWRRGDVYESATLVNAYGPIMRKAFIVEDATRDEALVSGERRLLAEQALDAMGRERAGRYYVQSDEIVASGSTSSASLALEDMLALARWLATTCWRFELIDGLTIRVTGRPT